MKITKSCIINELDIATMLYLFTRSTLILRNKIPLITAVVNEIYYLALYVKEMLNEDEYFNIVLAGQEVNDLYTTPYDKWKEKHQIYFDINLNLSDPLVIKGINEQYAVNIRRKSKPLAIYNGRLNKLIRNIFKIPRSRKEWQRQMNAIDPLVKANTEQQSYECETYEYDRTISIIKCDSVRIQMPIPSIVPDKVSNAKKGIYF
jgi:hypothetical protein